MKGDFNMLHPSYTDLMTVVNSEVEPGEEKVVNSRYSIVLATAKRARQIIDGAKPLVDSKCPKPLSIAVDEVYNSKVRILTEEEIAEEERMLEEARLAREEAGEEVVVADEKISVAEEGEEVSDLDAESEDTEEQDMAEDTMTENEETATDAENE